MAEISNQSHLVEMGITPWYARFSLSGAAPSPDIKLDTEITLKKQADASRPQAAPVSSLPGSRKNIVAIKSLVGEPLSPAATQDEAASSTGVLERVSEQQDIVGSDSQVSPEVLLDAYSTGQFVIISESSESRGRVEEIALLQNILHAAGIIGTNIQFKGSFVWPIFNSPKLSVGSDHFYKHILKRWLSSVMLPQYDTCLIFGGRYQSLVEGVHSIVTAPGKHNKMFFQSSISDLLKMPARKAAVWEQFSGNMEKTTGIGPE